MNKILIFLGLFFLASINADTTARAVISSVDRTVISAEIAGNIARLPYGEGEYFRRGDLLAKIECDIYEAQKRKVEVQKNIAKLQMQKNEELEKLNSIGSFEVLISKEEYKKQEAELNIVSVNVDRCSIYAPFNGRIVEKKVNTHQGVKPQQELLEIVGTSTLEARVVVPATWINRLKKGDKFILEVDETQTQIKAEIKEVGAVVDPTSQTVLVRARLLKPYGKIITGMSGTAKFKF